MIHAAILILPAALCLFWALIHSLLVYRSNTTGLYVLMLLCVSVAAFAESGAFFHEAEWGSNAHSRLFMQLVVPSIIPLLMLYLDHLEKDARHYRYQLIWITIPAALFTSALILTILMGVDRVNQFLTQVHLEGDSVLEFYKNQPESVYFDSTESLFRIVMLVEVFVFIGFVIVHTRREHLHFRELKGFLFHGEQTGIKEVQYSLITLIILLATFKILITEHYLHLHANLTVSWSVMFSILVFVECYVALFSAKERISIREMFNGFRYNYRHKNQSAVMEQMIGEMVEDVNAESLQRILEKIGIHSNLQALQEVQEKNKETESLANTLFSAVSRSWADDSLRSRFQHMMIDEQAFLQPGLTLADVSERLHSNKTYVSKMVNQTYNMGFPEVLSILRIDYAEQYITSHRDATQDEIAKACGFLSASSLNSTFKRITGYTPKVWAARNDEFKNG